MLGVIDKSQQHMANTYKSSVFADNKEAWSIHPITNTLRLEQEQRFREMENEAITQQEALASTMQKVGYNQYQQPLPQNPAQNQFLENNNSDNQNNFVMGNNNVPQLNQGVEVFKNGSPEDFLKSLDLGLR
jgi:hypothetical protein